MHATDTTGSGAIDHGRLLALINNMTDGVLAIDGGGQITLSNSAALSLLDTNTLKGKGLASSMDVINKDGRQVDLLKWVQEANKPLMSRDLRLRYSDGSTANLFISIAPVRLTYGSSDGGEFVILLRDITREKSLEEERDEFISVASHELRTPIAITEGNVGNAILLAQRAGVSDTIIQALTAAHDQIIFLGNLINDLAMLSRAERGHLMVTVEQIDLKELADTLIKAYRPQAEEKGLTFEIVFEGSENKLSSSKLYVREILQNFITNAIKYTEKGGVTLKFIGSELGYKFDITDTGIGIQKTDLSKLFTKFFRSEDWRIRQHNGTGLGLYVTAKLIKLLNAKLDVASEYGKGSTFSVFIPNITQSSSLQPKETAANPLQSPLV